MINVTLSDDQLIAFRETLNGAITVLVPNIKSESNIPDLTKDQLRLIAGVLGTKGTAREVEAYVKLELKKWANDPIRKKIMSNLLTVINKEIEILEFYPKGNQKEIHPLPTHVKIINADVGKSDKEMPIEEFIKMLEDIHDSSVFKR